MKISNKSPSKKNLISSEALHPIKRNNQLVSGQFPFKCDAKWQITGKLRLALAQVRIIAFLVNRMPSGSSANRFGRLLSKLSVSYNYSRENFSWKMSESSSINARHSMEFQKNVWLRKRSINNHLNWVPYDQFDIIFIITSHWLADWLGEPINHHIVCCLMPISIATHILRENRLPYLYNSRGCDCHAASLLAIRVFSVCHILAIPCQNMNSLLIPMKIFSHKR